MANIKSQKKRILTNEKARMANKQMKSQIKTSIKKFKLSLSDEKIDSIPLRNKAISLIDKSFSKGIYHKNKVNRLKSQLMLLNNK